MRWLLALLAVAALLGAATPALAQDPNGTPDAVATETPDPDATETPDPDATETPTPDATEDVCSRGGADAQYADCAPCSADSADADYTYGCACRLRDAADADYTYVCLAASGGGPTPVPSHPARAVQQAQALHTLPLTGGQPILVGLIGLSFVLGGAGLRLRLR